MAVLAVVLWFLADRTLGGDQADFLPLLFNSAMRLTIFFGSVWLLARLRQVLAREDALLLPGMDAAAAATYVERLRQRLHASMAERGWPVTFSIGVASYRVAPDDLDAVLATADGLMYEVKQGGRERIQQGAFSGGRAAAPPSVP